MYLFFYSLRVGISRVGSLLPTLYRFVFIQVADAHCSEPWASAADVS